MHWAAAAKKCAWRCRRSTPPCRTPHPTWNGSPSWGSPGGSATRWSAPPRRSAAREDELEGVDRGAVQVGAVLDRPPGVVEGGALHRQDAGALPVLERRGLGGGGGARADRLRGQVQAHAV